MIQVRNQLTPLYKYNLPQPHPKTVYMTILWHYHNENVIYRQTILNIIIINYINVDNDQSKGTIIEAPEARGIYKSIPTRCPLPTCHLLTIDRRMFIPGTRKNVNLTPLMDMLWSIILNKLVGNHVHTYKSRFDHSETILGPKN
jgi:hypothetical protein